jgi:hypothetical protein
LSLGPSVGVTNQDFAVEDLFPPDFYKAVVEEVYRNQLTAAGVASLRLVGNDMLCKRVERALEEHGIKFNKGSVAKVLRGRIAKMKAFAELPEQTQKYVHALVAAINSAFGQ